MQPTLNETQLENTINDTFWETFDHTTLATTGLSLERYLGGHFRDHAHIIRRHLEEALDELMDTNL